MYQEIWRAYIESATLRAVAKAIWRTSTIAERTVILGILIGFIASLILYAFGRHPVVAFVCVAVTDIVLILIWGRLKVNAFGISNDFLGDKDYRASRYSLFRRALEDQGVSAQRIHQCTNLFRAEIERTTGGWIYGRKATALALSIGLLFLGAGIQHTDWERWGAPVAVASLVVVMSFFASALVFRTKEECLREMMVYLELYLIELDNGEVQADKQTVTALHEKASKA